MLGSKFFISKTKTGLKIFVNLFSLFLSFNHTIIIINNTQKHSNQKEAARNVARVSGEVGLKLIEGIEDPEEYVESFRSHMMPVVEAWCNGKSFAEVCKSTTVFEGLIVFKRFLWPDTLFF